jgi:hypothetical protein
MVALAIGFCWNVKNVEVTLDPKSSSTIFAISANGTGGHSSKTPFSALTYCGGKRSLFVANTWPTLR